MRRRSFLAALCALCALPGLRWLKSEPPEPEQDVFQATLGYYRGVPIVATENEDPYRVVAVNLSGLPYRWRGSA